MGLPVRRAQKPPPPSSLLTIIVVTWSLQTADSEPANTAVSLIYCADGVGKTKKALSLYYEQFFWWGQWNSVCVCVRVCAAWVCTVLVRACVCARAGGWVLSTHGSHEEWLDDDHDVTPFFCATAQRKFFFLFSFSCISFPSLQIEVKIGWLGSPGTHVLSDGRTHEGNEWVRQLSSGVSILMQKLWLT